MKKRIATALCLLVTLLLLGACGKDAAEVDYNGYSYEDLELLTKQSCRQAMDIADGLNRLGIAQEELTEVERQMLISYNNITEPQLDSGIRWNEVEAEAGMFVEVKEDSFSVTKSGNTLTTNLRLVFEKREVDFQVVFTYYNMQVSGITIEPAYTLSERLAKAGLNTLISVMIVFCVLILISLLIACFQIFPYLEKRKRESEEAATQKQTTDSFVNQVVERETIQNRQMTDDSELVAVIAAAIAAATGGSANDFVVRSICRRK